VGVEGPQEWPVTKWLLQAGVRLRAGRGVQELAVIGPAWRCAGRQQNYTLQHHVCGLREFETLDVLLAVDGR
jgi:hypothetical protein